MTGSSSQHHKVEPAAAKVKPGLVCFEPWKLFAVRWQRRAHQMLARAASALAVALMLAGVAKAEPSEALLQDGAYEVRARLEIPNVVNYAATSTATICLPHAAGADGPPFPVLSSNNPLARCPASNLERDGATLRFDIVCAGRGAAFARAVYTLLPRAFEGRIAMVMGGKNMTMTEVQSGRRVGSCDPSGAPPS
jgi:hypothetical protein